MIFTPLIFKCSWIISLHSRWLSTRVNSNQIRILPAQHVNKIMCLEQCCNHWPSMYHQLTPKDPKLNPLSAEVQGYILAYASSSIGFGRRISQSENVKGRLRRGCMFNVLTVLFQGVWTSTRCSEACPLNCPVEHGWWNAQSSKCFANSLFHTPPVPVMWSVFGVCAACSSTTTEATSDQRNNEKKYGSWFKQHGKHVCVIIHDKIHAFKSNSQSSYLFHIRKYCQQKIEDDRNFFWFWLAQTSNIKQHISTGTPSLPAMSTPSWFSFLDEPFCKSIELKCT